MELVFVYQNKKDKLVVCDSGKDTYPFDDDTFDVTFCKSGIEHVNPDHLISEMYRVTKPGGKIIIITSEMKVELNRFSDHIITVPKINHCLQSVLTTIPLQILAYQIAVMKECDVDMPRNLAKVVTVE